MIDPVKHNPFIAQFLLVLAIFINAMAPLSVVTNQLFPVEEGSLEGLFGSKILICTPTGFKYISYDELQNNSEDGTPLKQSHCSLCQINTDDNPLFLLSAKVLYKIEIAIATVKFDLLSNVLKSKIKYVLPFLRAPPVLL